ncbi:hypothetical protein AC1031_018154 [Aphanomyces cochlioides]|nr:hypothetical protein AC1031_018154 [Aphanomyces cochlioides]
MEQDRITLGQIVGLLGSISRRLDVLEKQVQCMPGRIWTDLGERVPLPVGGVDVSHSLRLAFQAFTNSILESTKQTVERTPMPPPPQNFSRRTTKPVAEEAPPVERSAPNTLEAPRQLPTEYAEFIWSDGTIHPMPEDFEMPKKVNTRIMWGLWFHGDQDRNICPYRNFQRKDFTSNISRNCLWTARRVMNALVDIALANGWVPDEEAIPLLGPNAFELLFEKTFNELIKPPSDNYDIGEKPAVIPKRLAKFSYTNVYKSCLATRKPRIERDPINLPPDWEFPQTTCRAMWRLWFHGDRPRGVGPLRHLRSIDFRQSSGKVAESASRVPAARGLMEKLVEIAEEHGFIKSADELNAATDATTLDSIFEDAFDILLNYNPEGNLAGDEQGVLRSYKAGEYSYLTVVHVMREQQRKRKRT